MTCLRIFYARGVKCLISDATTLCKAVLFSLT